MKKDYHINLANYFQSKPLYLDGEEFKKPNVRKLVEQPWQQTKANQWKKVKNTLCDLMFIEAKCLLGHTYGLLQDFNLAESKVNKSEIGHNVIGDFNWNEWKDFLIREEENFLYFSKRIPQIVFQQAYNSLYHPSVAKMAKTIENNGQSPKSTWFKIYDREVASFSLKPPICLRKPIIGKRRPYNQDLTALTIINQDCIVSGYLDGFIGVWQASTGNRIYFGNAHSWSVNSIIKISDSLFATGGSDDIIKIWDINNLESPKKLQGHTSNVLCLKNWKNKYLISGSSDKNIRIWDLNDISKQSKICKWHKGAIVDIVFVDPKYFISVSNDKTFGFWNLITGNLISYTNRYTNAGNHKIAINSLSDIFSYGTSGIIFWGNRKKHFRFSFKKHLCNKSNEIFPITSKDTEFCGNSFIWLSHYEAMISDLEKIIKYNVNTEKYDILLANADPVSDFHLGIYKIDQTTMITWNTYGNIWKWDLINMERKLLTNLPRGKPSEVVQLNKKYLLVGTELSEEIYIVDLFPEKIELTKTNCIVTVVESEIKDKYITNLKNDQSYMNQKTINSSRNFLTDIDCETRIQLGLDAGFQRIPLDDEILERRENWLSITPKLKTNYGIDVRNYFLYLMEGNNEMAVLPGYFDNCDIYGKRLVAKEPDGKKVWIEIMNSD